MLIEKIKNTIMVIIGASVAAAGLQFFLLPNHLLDGGVTGLSIIGAKLSGLPLGAFLVILNVPFIIMGYRKFGREFARLSIIGIVTFAALTFVHIDTAATDVPILATIFGGTVVGIGAGLVFRYGGILDGADTVAVFIDKRTIFSVSEAVLAINSLIILCGGFVFGWENAMYSLVAYYVIHKTIHTTSQGFDESRILWIVTSHPHKVHASLDNVVHHSITYLDGKVLREIEHEPYTVMFVVLTRLDEMKVQQAVHAVDPHAFMVTTSAHEPVSRDVDTA